MNDDVIEQAMKEVYQGSEARDWSPYNLLKPLFVVWAVEKVQGLTDNGGFEYFFENDWPEHPPYSIFVEALREIDALEAAACLQKAIDNFPFVNPHLDCEKRREHLKSSRSSKDADDSIIDHLGFHVMDMSDDTYSKLKAYIRRNSHFSQINLTR